MRILGTVAAVLAAVAVYAFSAAPAQKKIDVAKFDKISAHGVTEVIYKAGKTQSVSIDGNEDLVKATSVTVEKGRLTIRQDGESLKNVDLPDDAKVVVTITTPSLTAISLEGATTFKGSGIKESKLQVSAKGASTIELVGSAKDLEINSNGAASLLCGKLKSETCSVHATGATSVKVSVSKSLEVNASGVASVHYDGSPSVSKKVSGIASVDKG